MCTRAFCVDCGEEMIHRDHRKFYESASGLGQIVHRDMTRFGFAGDADLIVERTRYGKTLLRVVEQKQGSHRLDGSQRQALTILNACIVHATTCEEFTGYDIASESGVWLVFGEITPETARGRLELPDVLTVKKLNEPDEQELERLEFLRWLPSTAEERTWSATLQNRVFMRPDKLVAYLQRKPAAEAG